jgi:hypothetical protein
MTGLIKDAIDELGCGVVVKLNWSSPKARHLERAGAATTMRARTRAQPVMLDFWCGDWRALGTREGMPANMELAHAPRHTRLHVQNSQSIKGRRALAAELEQHATANNSASARQRKQRRGM